MASVLSLVVLLCSSLIPRSAMPRAKLSALELTLAHGQALNEGIPSLCPGPPPSTACETQMSASITQMRIAEGVEPFLLPSNYGSLTPAEEVFVIINLERIDRGLPPIAGLTVSLSEAALAGANADTDPVPITFGPFASLWAGGTSDALIADYDWMYNDGAGGNNLDCTATVTSGCWGHRKNILVTFSQGGEEYCGGSAYSNSTSYRFSFAFLISLCPIGTPYTFSWAAELPFVQTPQPYVPLLPSWWLFGGRPLGGFLNSVGPGQWQLAEHLARSVMSVGSQLPLSWIHSGWS